MLIFHSVFLTLAWWMRFGQRATTIVCFNDSLGSPEAEANCRKAGAGVIPLFRWQNFAALRALFVGGCAETGIV